MKIPMVFGFLTLSSLFAVAVFGAHSDRVRLQDVQVLTLRHGQDTTARRSRPVPQLNCVGGSAANKFIPQVVQCYNRGSDGYDIQWECKTDMDNAYRFGRVEVTCEGYDYPDDPYILRGSCGLEYTLDYTKEGYQQSRQEQHQYYGNQHYDDNYYDRSSSSYSYGHKKTGSGLGGLITLGVAAVIIYFIYKHCLSGETHPDPTAPQHDDPPPYSRYDNQPPPPGFKPEFTSSSNYSGSSGGYPGSSTNARQQSHTGTSSGGGFWSGMATGGLLGYLFGNNQGYGNYGYQYGPGYHHRPRSTWGGWGSNFFGGSGYSSGRAYSRPSTSSFFGGSSSSSSSSTGTRTASGFGGTKRR